MVATSRGDKDYKYLHVNILPTTHIFLYIVYAIGSYYTYLAVHLFLTAGVSTNTQRKMTHYQYH